VAHDLHIFGDRAALERLVLNLLLNAARFTSMGKITVRCRVAGAGANGFELVVSDTGRGMTEDAISLATQPFVLSADPGVVGHNHSRRLGLMLCSAIASAHGGSMQIESRLGAGTAVTVRLQHTPAQRGGGNLQLIRRVA
jgi:cell cycle sensor histidine kinase DivJ